MTILCHQSKVSSFAWRGVILSELKLQRDIATEQHIVHTEEIHQVSMKELALALDILKGKSALHYVIIYQPFTGQLIGQWGSVNRLLTSIGLLTLTLTTLLATLGLESMKGTDVLLLQCRIRLPDGSSY